MSHSFTQLAHRFSITLCFLHGWMDGSTDGWMCVTSIFLYACESWTLTAKLHRRIRAVGMRCYGKILRICYHRGSLCQDSTGNGPHEDLLTIVKRRKLKRYGHISCSSGVAETILQGAVKGRRRQSRQKKRREDSIRERTGVEFAKSQRAVENRE